MFRNSAVSHYPKYGKDETDDGLEDVHVGQSNPVFLFLITIYTLSNKVAKECVSKCRESSAERVKPD